MRAGSIVATTTDNAPHWKRGMRGKLLHWDGGSGWMVDFGEGGIQQVPRDQLEVIISVIELFPDVAIWVCDRDEANVLVRENRSEAWRIWLKEEFAQHLLDDNEELLEVIEKKKQKPGPYFKKKES